jgi:hypothetical protein
MSQDCFRHSAFLLGTWYSCRIELSKVFLPSPDLAAEPQFETNFRASVHQAISYCLVAPITTRANAFAKAALFHPDVCRLLQHGAVSETVFNACVDVVRKDIDSLSGQGSVASRMTNIMFDGYLKECKKRPASVFLGFDALKANGRSLFDIDPDKAINCLVVLSL